MSNRQKIAAVKPVVQAAATDQVVVAYIHPGQTSAYFTQSLVNMMMFDQATGRHIVGCLNEWSSANVSASRNSLTEQFLDHPSQAEWLLWIDADMAFDHDALDLLLASADATERPIIGGLCFGAANGLLFPTIYLMGDVDGKPTTVRVGDYPLDQVVSCAATGSAFVLIHRDVLTAIRDKAFNAAFPWYQETELAGKPAGEDITFCLRAGILGFPVHVDTSVKVGHHKSTVLSHGMFQAQKGADDGLDSDAGRSEAVPAPAG